MTETPTPPDMKQFRARQKSRNLALGLVLVGLVVLFYAITFVRLGAQHS
jgi:hypothetical protein